MVSAIAEAALKAGGDIEKLEDRLSRGSAAADRRQGGGNGGDDRREHEGPPHRRSCASSRASIGSYLHNQIAPGLGKIGVLVAVESAGQAGKARRLWPASSPCILRRPIRWRSISAAFSPMTLAREKAILEEKNAGKPANVLQKIFDSGLKSFAKEHRLLEQAYVHDGCQVGDPGAEGGRGAGRRAGQDCRFRPHAVGGRDREGSATISPPKSPRPRRAARPEIKKGAAVARAPSSAQPLPVSKGEVPQAGDQKQRVRQTGTWTNFGMPWNHTLFMR